MAGYLIPGLMDAALGWDEAVALAELSHLLCIE